MLNLVPFEPTGSNIFNYLDNLEKSFFRGFYPLGSHFRTDIEDREDRFVLTSELPGYEKEDISIDISEDMLTIRAENHSEKETDEDENRYIRKERNYGCLSRSFNVSGIDTDDIYAQYKNGILTLELPKKTPQHPDVKKIEIQ